MYKYLKSSLLLISLLIIIASCKEENPGQPDDLPYLRGMMVTWNERMKMPGSHVLAGSPDESWFTPADVVRMKNAGATCLELHQIGLPSLMPERNIPDEVFFTNWLDTWVDWCTQHQMYCIINITGFGAWADWAFYLSMPEWLYEDVNSDLGYSDKAACDSLIREFFDLDITRQNENRAAFINLWKYMADRYKENRYVMYSIMNEPFWDVDIPDETTAIHLGQTYSTFMEQIIDGIRSTGSDQYILVDLPFLWDSNWEFTVQPVHRDKIIWEAHVYGSVWDPQLQSFKENLNGIKKLLLDTFEKPLFIGEYGINPIASIHDNSMVDWKSVITEEINYMYSFPLTGRQYTSWDDMYNEYAIFSGESPLTEEESEWIITSVLSSGKEPEQ